MGLCMACNLNSVGIPGDFGATPGSRENMGFGVVSGGLPFVQIAISDLFRDLLCGLLGALSRKDQGTCLRLFGFGPRDSFSQTDKPPPCGISQTLVFWGGFQKLGRDIGTGKRGHYERGLFTGEISRKSKISKFSRISRKWSDPLCFPQSGGSLETLESLNSLESLEKGLF